LRKLFPNVGSASINLTQPQPSIVQVGVDCNLTPDGYGKLMNVFGPFWISVRDQITAAMARPQLRELGAALKAYADEKKEFPRGTFARPTSAATRANLPWPPDERVSWMASLLPYLGFNDVLQAINTQRSWDDPENFNPSITMIPQLLDPQDQAHWWVAVNQEDRPIYAGRDIPRAATSFVGVAGVGMDAANYAPDDPAMAKKIGVFGYDRVTKVEDIKDGPANTIALLQVAPFFRGAWLAGGGSTVRGVPETKSVQPFVCTTYDGKRGTIAIMANGDVRFIPETIADDKFKALCTINGGEQVDVDDVAPLIKAEAAPQPPPAAPPAAPPATTPATSSSTGTTDARQLILGTWKIQSPEGTILDFGKDGTVGITQGGLNLKANYQFLDDSTIAVTMPGQPEPEKMKVQVSEQELVTTDSKGKVDKFQRATGAAAQVEWKEFTSPECGFAVMFPGTPKVTTQKDATTGTTNRTFEVMPFILECFEMADQTLTPKVRLDNMTSFLTARFKGSKIKSQKEIQLGSNPGREVVLEMTQNNVPVTLTIHMYVAKPHVFELISFNSPLIGGASQEQKFFDSFRLLDQGGSPAPGTPAPTPGTPEPKTGAEKSTGASTQKQGGP